jgi:hypothetical protein
MRLGEVQRADGRLAEAEASYQEAERLFGRLPFAKGNQGPEGEVLCGRRGAFWPLGAQGKRRAFTDGLIRAARTGMWYSKSGPGS